MYRLPAPSRATSTGLMRLAALAGPPSPSREVVPPATVVMMPPVVTLRTRPADASAMYKVPELSTTMPCGLCSVAEVAGPPSPMLLLGAPPAYVVMMPAETLRILPLYESEIYISPLGAKATCDGPNNSADVAGPLSPTPPGWFSVPATMWACPVLADTIQTTAWPTSGM